MAIPFNLPSHEETEDNYRRLDQLLLDLYNVLRQILLRPRCDQDLHTERRESERDDEGPAPHGPDGASSRQRQGLPDLVLSTSCSTRRHRRSRRRRPTSLSSSCCPHQNPRRTQETSPSRSHREPTCQTPEVDRLLTPALRQENWLVIGEQLRRIAEEFTTTFKTQQVSTAKEENLKMEVKTSGLFSLIVPTHFRSSLWTTMILLVGWRLLVRSR